MSFSILVILCLFVSLCHGIEYPNSLSLRGEKYKAHWKFDNETEMFYFKVEVMNVSGWVAFGVSRLLYPSDPEQEWNFNSMQYYDVIVGGVYDNRSSYYKVCLQRFQLVLLGWHAHGKSCGPWWLLIYLKLLVHEEIPRFYYSKVFVGVFYVRRLEADCFNYARFKRRTSCLIPRYLGAGF